MGIIRINVHSFFNNFRNGYISIILYIITNIINITILSQATINGYEILSLSGLQSPQFISFSTKCISILIYTYVIFKNISLDYNRNACILFTRITKKKWIKNKLFAGLCILFLFRLPLYIFLHFSYDCIIDLLIYILILICIMYYLTNNTETNLFVFVSILLRILVNKININLLIMVYSLLFCIIIINVLSKHVRKNKLLKVEKRPQDF